jgi:hypothetical protein
MCRVYAALQRTDAQIGLQLRGTLSGPHCQYADTLPTTYRFIERGPNLAEALVPEPCYWTPQMPLLYDAVLELHDRGRVVARAERILGICRRGVRRRNLVLEGQSWVLRGVAADEVPHADLDEWHAAETAMCVRNPSDALCDAASRLGVLLVAELGKAESHEIVRLRRWPAVGVIATSASAGLDAAASAIVAQVLTAVHPAVPGADAVAAIVDVSADEPLDAKFAHWQIPVIALRKSGPHASVADARRQCDRLQRDLAHLGQFAGYIV